MTGKRAPDWLAELQSRFGDVLRTPLDRGTGTLRAATSAYDTRDARDRPAAPATERLAVYNRQYWFRLFTVMQTAFPRTAGLLGPWAFNQHAERFLLARPPRGWSIDDACDGFERFLAESLPDSRARDALLEAASIDAAWRAVFLAPEVAPYRPSAEDASRLLSARLVASRATAVVVEHWPLLELKAQLAARPDERALRLPKRLTRPRAWALVRESEGIRRYALEPREAELLGLLRDHAVRDALALLEAACTGAERAALPAHARGWLARSVERGMWSGLAEPAASG